VLTLPAPGGPAAQKKIHRRWVLPSAGARKKVTFCYNSGVRGVLPPNRRPWQAQERRGRHIPVPYRRKTTGPRGLAATLCPPGAKGNT